MKPHAVAAAAALLLLSLVTGAVVADASGVLVSIPGVPGDTRLLGYEDRGWFDAHTFDVALGDGAAALGDGAAALGGGARTGSGGGASTGSTDAAARGGAVTITKPLNSASPVLAQAAAEGSTFDGIVTVDFVVAAHDQRNLVYLRYVLDGVSVLGWSTRHEDDGADNETVRLLYEKIAFSYRTVNERDGVDESGRMAWNAERNSEWSELPFVLSDTGVRRRRRGLGAPDEEAADDDAGAPTEAGMSF